MNVIKYISFFMMFSGIILFFRAFLNRKKNKFQLEKNIKKNPIFCILIPAREESNVIENILKSIQNQTFHQNLEDVFVIVERNSDPTIAICEIYGASVIIREHLEKKTKGYALQEGIDFLIKKKKWYDAYFIFDADNILDKNYLLEMEKDVQKGFAISTGYRNYLNGNDSLIAAASGIIYFFINRFRNKLGLKYQKNIILSGTGFYIHGDYIKRWQTYPFHSLTEDVELSYYAAIHEMSTNYNEDAIFYDEQPLNYQESKKQRIRWIKGFLSNWLKNIPKLKKQLKEKNQNKGCLISMMYGIAPLLLMVFGVIFYMISIFISSSFHIQEINIFKDILIIISILFLIYLILFISTYLILKFEKNKINLNKTMQRKVLWFHPIFLITYLPVFLSAIFSKKVEWETINHGENKKN